MIREGNVFREVTLPELKNVAQEIATHVRKIPVCVFFGEMGAGKTTLIKEIGLALQVTDAMSSPTFSIVNEYATAENDKVFHFDFYRIRNEREALDIGTEEYFYSGYTCLVEWPEKIPSILPAEVVAVNLTIENESLRTIAISVHDGKEENRF